jgi:hypothetical protein
MKRGQWLILAAAFGLFAMSSCRHASTQPPQSPKQAVDQFYKLETEGRWLGPEHWNELQDYFQHVRPWYPPNLIWVLKGYQVDDAKKTLAYLDIVNYEVEVDYLAWGQIDPALHFQAVQGPRGNSSASGTPITQPMFDTWSHSNTFEMTDSSGRSATKNGKGRWRMTDLGMPVVYQPAVNLDAALRWVTRMRDKSSDPLIKYNANETIAILNSLSSGIFPQLKPAGKPSESASRVVAQFIALESRLTPDEWDQLAKFFVETPKPMLDRVEIVDVVGSGAYADWDTAHAELDTNSLGVLDSSMRLSKYPMFRQPLDGSSASACFGDYRIDFDLLLSSEHWEAAKDGTVQQLNGPLAWRVEYFSPLLNLDTAIRYVTQTRDKTADPAVKLNAVKTLRILNFYKEGKPVPNKLYAESSGGCG